MINHDGREVSVIRSLRERFQRGSKNAPSGPMQRHAVGLKLPPIQREIAVGGIAASEWAGRQTVWQAPALTSPPKPTSAGAKGDGERTISIRRLRRWHPFVG